MASQPSGHSVPDPTPQPQAPPDPLDQSQLDPNGDHAVEPEREPEGTYARLAEPFDITFNDVRGGVELTYISGEQVASRLNLTLGGPGYWDFTIPRDGYDEIADAFWCLGHLEAEIDGKRCVREQYGAAAMKRQAPRCAWTFGEDTVRAGELCNDAKFDHDKRHGDHTFIPGAKGAPLNIGYDKKSAATDAFKKCSQGIGVGLYLSARKQTRDGKGVSAAVGNGRSRPPSGGSQQQGSSSRNGTQTARGSQAARTGATSAAATTPGTTGPTTSHKCTADGCGAELREQPFNDNSKWTIEQLSEYSRALTQELTGTARELCFTHYKVANKEKKRRAEQAGTSTTTSTEQTAAAS